MKNNKKRNIVSMFAISMAIFTMFTSVAFATEYEDKYAKNGNVGMRESEMYEALYEVNNHSGLEQHVIMHFVVQPKDNVKQNDFIYKFEGKFNSEDEWGTHEFEFDFGSPVEYGEMGTVTLNGENAYLYQAQFGIYPGYYNFYNFGHNYLAWDSASNVCLMKTLTNDFSLTAEDENGGEVWVEVTEIGDPRIYVLIGEKTWIEQVGSDFEEWAQSYDVKAIENVMDTGEQSEIKVEVPDENLDNLLENAKPSVEIEEGTGEETSPFLTVEEEGSLQEEEEQKSNTWVMVGILVAGMVIIAGTLVGARVVQKIRNNKY